MALVFDGDATTAKAVLPAGLIPTGPPGGTPFSLTFWFKPEPVLEEGTDQPTISGPMVLLDIRGKSGPLAIWTIERNLSLGFSVPGSTAQALTVDLTSMLGQWMFASSTFQAPDDTHPHGRIGLAVTSGGPLPAPTGADLEITPNPVDEPRLLTVGNLPAADFPGDLPDVGPYRGMIARLRLWTTALQAAEISGHMYDDRIGPKGFGGLPLAGDWRMNEGYGTVAYDYAAPGASVLPVRYQPPGGNHLHLGTGGVHTEPQWAVASLATLVRKASSSTLP